MLRLWSIVALLLLCGTMNLSAQQSGDLIGVADFQSIDTKGNIELQIIQSDSTSTLMVEYHNIRQDEFKYKVRKGVLYLDVPSGLFASGGFARVVVTTGRLERIKSEGASIECLTPIVGEYFEYTTQGSVNIAMLDVMVDRLTIKTIGKSDVMVVGSAKEVNLSAKVGSRIDAFKVVAQTAIVESYDASEIYVCPSQTLKATASMAGSVYYMGTESVEPKASLWGDIVLIERAKYRPIYVGTNPTKASTPTKPTTTTSASPAPVPVRVQQSVEPAEQPAPKITEKPAERKIEKKTVKKREPQPVRQSAPASTDGDFF